VAPNGLQWRSQPENFGGAEMYDFRRIILFGKTPLEAQNDFNFQKNFAPPPGYAYDGPFFRFIWRYR